MRLWLITVLTILGISAALAESWPPLPTGGFISGRPATDKDVIEGNAVFALRAYGAPFGEPLDVTIPQYAYLKRRGQQPIPVIVLQAELGKGLKIFGSTSTANPQPPGNPNCNCWARIRRISASSATSW